MTGSELLADGPAEAAHTLVLAHGAGAPMDSPFMGAVAREIAQGGVRVVRFEFPYMRARREGGRGGVPDREPVLRQAWLDVIARHGGGKGVVIGGKSLGGRIASLVADEAGARGLVCLGYPFHPPGQPTRLRTAHLAGLRTPTLIVQGTRDPFGTREDVAGYVLSPAIRLAWIDDGDHSLRTSARSGRTAGQSLATAVGLVLEFLRGLDPGGSGGPARPEAEP